MNTSLLFEVNGLDTASLRGHARLQVISSPLMQRCAKGDTRAISAFFAGFWPFVAAFEKAIDEHTAQNLPIKTLIAQFGRNRVASYIEVAREALKEMRREEGSHALVWKKEAEVLKVDLSVPAIGAVRGLMREVLTDEKVPFFCRLAATEYIAEELSRHLCDSKSFTAILPNNRWGWGDIHLASHDGPSHLQLDEDIACAISHCDNGGKIDTQLIHNEIRKFQELFFRASSDIERELAPETEMESAAIA